MTSTTALTTTRLAPGRYLVANGYTVIKVEDFDGVGLGGWHLIDPTGEWCNTFATKRDAVAASGRIENVCDRHPLTQEG